jgi:hypothetical protein
VRGEIDFERSRVRVVCHSEARGSGVLRRDRRSVRLKFEDPNDQMGLRVSSGPVENVDDLIRELREAEEWALGREDRASS